ncbi:unnamed protein product [Cochlearia groenlandica]
MANLIQRFFRNQSCLKSIPRINPNLIPHQKPCIDIVESLSVDFESVPPLANPVLTFAGNKSDEAMRFYPSYPIGYGFNPGLIHDSGLIETAVEEEEEKKTVVIYADSVKKKRKKKMNKHKYRKLRKIQGRKS